MPQVLGEKMGDEAAPPGRGVVVGVVDFGSVHCQTLLPVQGSWELAPPGLGSGVWV